MDVVSNTHLLKRFDNLRKQAKAKMKKGAKETQYREYVSCSKMVREDVRAACESAKKQITEFEKRFFFQHNRLPLTSEYSSYIRELTHKRNIAQRVLAHEWNHC